MIHKDPHRDLLKKYIQHVGECEGVDFLADHYRPMDLFTDEEWAALKAVNKETTKEN